ncbi:MAG: MBL fold metallo-hydrolase [Candidatus Caldarchaeum sp.]|nr:MBL fold metallo-hydrolase [Candidatus Caldarchaeum sp.]MDW8435106.1 MBL fold metallo-hydrolase [Candidatus Caldarchaeum sp.]
MKTTVYGGAGKIGGNKILLESESRIFLDFGVDFNGKSKFFSTFLQPRRFSLVKDYILTGVLPNIEGLYIHDLSRPFADAVVISHGHIDHYGHASLIRKDIPIHLGETTKLLIQARENTKPKSPEHLIHTERQHKIHTFKTGEVFKIGDNVVHPVHVDHSIPASYGFVVETDGGVLAYSGDLRLHGPKAQMTQDFVEKCVDKKVEVLIIEGTRINDDKTTSEEKVEKMIGEIAWNAADKLVIVVAAMMDFDRLNTVLKVAETTGRIAAISVHHANVLEYLRKAGRRISVPDMEEGRLVAFLEKKRTGTYSKNDYPRWMTELLNKVPTVTEGTISRNQRKYLLVLSKAEDIITLSDIKPEKGSPFVLSTSEPHSEEQILEMDKIENWVNLLELRFYHVHSSGHASQTDLLNIIERIQPKKVIPIHTEMQELFPKLLQQKGIDAEVIFPEHGRAINLF